VRALACDFFVPPVVELTDERELHIRLRHPDLLPAHLSALELTVNNPDHVKQNAFNPDKHELSKWFPDLKGGKFVVVQVITEHSPPRNWIVTAYLLSDKASIY
jgi:hypothetical protein